MGFFGVYVHKIESKSQIFSDIKILKDLSNFEFLT